ncbi:MAG: ATP-binding protein, partial [Thermodesulfobacteriota bacterium]
AAAVPSLPRAPAGFITWLAGRREALIREWIEMVVAVSPFYRERPLAELEWTISASFDANLEAVTTGSVSPLNRFVQFITRFRLAAGFPLSEVQKAFDAYRIILARYLTGSRAGDTNGAALESVNACVSYQIHHFSDLFQAMHEQEIRQRAENLEAQVEQRTNELAASEDRYRTLVEEIDDGYFILKDEKVVFVNRAYCEMHGAPHEIVVGRPFWEFVAAEDRDRMRSIYQDALSGRRTPRRIQYLRLGPGGKPWPTEIRARLVNLDQGPATIGICRDVTERLEMEMKIRAQERMAYVGQLTASLSHEIRNPLSAIKMNLQILARRTDLCGFDHRRIEIMVDYVTRLEGILRQVLDLAKPLALNTSFHDVNEMVRALLDLLSPKLAAKAVRVRKCLDRRLPRIRMDRGMIEQALMNLLLNAMEAVPEGGLITVRSRAVGKGLELSVRDNGAGLADHELEKIYTPFFSGKSHGSGLGLTNVKRIVEAHQGQVMVHSRPGGGARFVMLLPGTV